MRTVHAFNHKKYWNSGDNVDKLKNIVHRELLDKNQWKSGKKKKKQVDQLCIDWTEECGYFQ